MNKETSLIGKNEVDWCDLRPEVFEEWGLVNRMKGLSSKSSFE